VATFGAIQPFLEDSTVEEIWSNELTKVHRPRWHGPAH
jgi:hypothetical protein